MIVATEAGEAGILQGEALLNVVVVAALSSVSSRVKGSRCIGVKMFFTFTKN